MLSFVATKLVNVFSHVYFHSLAMYWRHWGIFFNDIMQSQHVYKLTVENNWQIAQSLLSKI
jgi:hypothetical protein